MPFTYHIDAAAGVLFVTSEGTVEQAERIATMRAWAKDSNFRPDLKMLCDFSDSTSAPSLDELQEIVGIARQHLDSAGRKKLAVVATRRVTFGVARQFQGLLDSKSLDMHIFPDRPSALAWLQAP